MVAGVIDATGCSLRALPGAACGDGASAEVGELVLRAPWPGMAAGFWQDEARYLDAYWSRFPNIWVHGDWARIDADGKRVGPAEYESALVDHALVKEAVAIGVPDSVKGEAVVCFVTLGVPGPDAEDWERCEHALRTHVGEHLGKPLSPARAIRPPSTRSAPVSPSLS